jgi:hypothetical protein
MMPMPLLPLAAITPRRISRARIRDALSIFASAYASSAMSSYAMPCRHAAIIFSASADADDDELALIARLMRRYFDAAVCQRAADAGAPLPR